MGEESQVAKEYLESFNKLLDVYAKVGEAIPGLLVHQSTFEKYPPLSTVLEDYYSDILLFHEAALGVFTRPSMCHSLPLELRRWVNGGIY